ncbi:MAG: Maf family protein [Myxococcota bacterium]|nr:Maf family protein [Myxococcota bacterium]
MGQTRLILASGSPRRRAFLESLGLQFEVAPAELDETPLPAEAPRAYVQRLAAQKADAVGIRFPQAAVLAADTTVVLEDEVLGKPQDASEARRMLERLSGRTHRVLTGVALGGAARGAVVVETEVRFRVLEEAQLRWYLASGEPMDKAGAYAIQGLGGAFVERITGSYSNVVGLPLVETLALLEQAGLRLPWEEHR